MAQIVTRVARGSGNITYEPTGSSAYYGDEYRFTATPAIGYVFTHWEYMESDNGHWHRSKNNPILLYFSAGHSHNTEAVAHFGTNRLLHGSFGTLLHGSSGALLHDA